MPSPGLGLGACCCVVRAEFPSLSLPPRRGSARGRDPCAVLYHLCFVRGCIVLAELNPALPAAHREAAGFPADPGVVHAYAATTRSTEPFE